MSNCADASNLKNNETNCLDVFNSKSIKNSQKRIVPTFYAKLCPFWVITDQLILLTLS